jgi:protoporphyrinogen oxidase
MTVPSEPAASPSTDTSPASPQVVVIGAGPAGLTAAYELAKHDISSTVLESDDMVGGISRTVERDGWRFDLGGHRFFTKVAPVEAFWHEILPDEDFLQRPRMSRIYYDGKFFDYPLKASNALKNLGIGEAVLCVLSYFWARADGVIRKALGRPKVDESLEDWITSRFGKRLFKHFFKTYNEKVWGVPASQLQADWAAQRIKNMSLWNAGVNAILDSLPASLSFLKRGKATDITSLIEEFQYPKYGPGMMWEVCRDKVEAAGSKVLMETRAVKIRHADDRAVAVVAEHAGVETEYPCSEIISSMPMSQLLLAMDPPPPADVLAAARDLRYRDFLTVALVVPEKGIFPDNWIYIHSPEVKVGRIQNFGSWSPYLVKEGRTCLGLEYFVFEGDDTWSMGRRGPRRPGQDRARQDRPRVGVRRRGRVRRAGAQGLSVLRRALQGQRHAHARLAHRLRPERAPGRPQRHAPLQQPGPLDVHGDALGGEHRQRHRLRRVGGERRGGVPRGDVPGGEREGHRPRRPGHPPRRVRTRPPRQPARQLRPGP